MAVAIAGSENTSYCDSDSLTSLSCTEDQNLELDNNGCLVRSRFNSAVQVQRETSDVVCDEMHINNSSRVHIGSKNIYKGHVIVNHIVSNNPTSTTTNNDSIELETNRDDQSDKESKKNENTSRNEVEPSRGSLNEKKWRYIRLYTIICILILLTIPIIFFVAWIIRNSSQSQNDFTSLYDLPSPPNGPVNITQLTYDSVEMFWGYPVNDGGTTIQVYKIEKKDVNETDWLEVGYSNLQQMVVGNLSVYHEYVFKIYAKNRIGFSTPLSTKEPFKIQPSIPSPPSSIKVKQILEDTVSIKWELPKSTGGIPLKAFIIEKKDSIVQFWLKTGQVDGNTFQYNVKNLRMNREYKFRVYAENEVGSSEPRESEKSIVIAPIFDSLEITRRKEWNASEPKIPPVQLEIIPPPYVIIYHTMPLWCFETKDCFTTVRKIQASAIEKGYGDIEYNFLIGPDNVFEGRGWDIEGNLTENYNHRSIAVGFLGSYGVQMPTGKELHTLKQLLCFGVENSKIAKNYKLLGQRQIVKNSTNPGVYLQTALQQFDHYVTEP